MMAVISDLQQRIATLEARGVTPRADPEISRQTASTQETSKRPEEQRHLQELQEQLKETSLASERLLSASNGSQMHSGN